MKILFAFIITFLIFYVIGLSFLILFKKITKHNYEDKIVLCPLIGIAAMLCISQWLIMAFSATVISVIWMCILFACLLFFGKEIFGSMKNYIINNKVLLIITFIVFTFFAFPLIAENSFISFQYSNNDIIYYLSTMDWLKGHSLMNSISYSDAHPYFLCADYILSTTRFGTDILDCVFMQLYGLQSHEIFSFMGIVYIALSGHIVYFFTNKVLKISNIYSYLIVAAILLNFTWKDLIILQYIPQILGICFLLAFTALLINYFVTKNTLSMALTSLFLIGTASTYSEFSSYMFIFYLGFTIIEICYSKQFFKTVKNVIYIGLLAIAMNPLGFFIAVKFNLTIFLKVCDSPNNIDSYHGNILSFFDIVAKCLGAPKTETILTPSNVMIYKAAMIIVFGLFISLIAYMLCKHRNKITMFILWIMCFFAGYELYFHSVKLAYGEYKHLISIAVITVIIFFYFLYKLECKRKIKILFLAFTVFAALITVKNYTVSYQDPLMELCTYNDLLSDVENGLSLVPSDENIGLLGNDHYKQHQLIYAAKDHNVQLMGTGINSYYSMLGMNLNNECPNYILCFVNEPDLNELDYSYEQIWCNERFKIMKRIEAR